MAAAAAAAAAAARRGSSSADGGAAGSFVTARSLGADASGVYTSDAASVAEAAYEKHAAAGRQQEGGISEAAASGASGRTLACPRGFKHMRRGASMVENAIASAVGEALGVTRKEQMREGDGGPGTSASPPSAWRTLELTRRSVCCDGARALLATLTTSRYTRGGGACASSATGGAGQGCWIGASDRTCAVEENVYYDGSMVKGGEGQGLSLQMCCDAAPAS